jgi:hypothetical protein
MSVPYETQISSALEAMDEVAVKRVLKSVYSTGQDFEIFFMKHVNSAIMNNDEFDLWTTLVDEYWDSLKSSMQLALGKAVYYHLVRTACLWFCRTKYDN